MHALSRVFRGKFLQALAQAGERAALPRDPADTATARQQRVRALRRHDWVVYAKTPLAGPAAVLDYLARYTHRTAIGNERLVAIDGDKVLLRVRADDTGGKRTVAMDGQQFIGRLLQHVLPPGFKRIRHYGLLAPAAKTERLALRASCWRCQQPTRRPARTRRPSCAAWRPSRSSAARIASSGTGASSSNAAPIARPLPRPRSPRAEDRRDSRAQTHRACMAWSHTRARAFVRQPQRIGAPGGPPAPLHRCRGAFVADLRPRPQPDIRCAVRRHCPPQRLKLTLPTPPPPRRFSPTRFI